MVWHAVMQQCQHDAIRGMNARTYTRGGVNGREVDEENPLDDVHIRVVSGGPFVQNPLEHIILLPDYQ